MYRIRRETGEEVHFGSIDELGAAVASGVVTAKAEIFHARAEKWLPIASHPHFKMAHDRINSATAPKASGQRPAVNASGQRPAITGPQAPQLRVMRPDAPSTKLPAAAEPSTAQKPAPRWNSAPRPAARAVAPKPSAPSAPPVSDLRLVRADIGLSGAATAPALPEVEFELLPELEKPAAIQPAATPAVIVEQTLAEPPVAEPAAIQAVPVEPVAYEPAVVEAAAAPAMEATVVERSPASVELVSHEQQPSARRGEVEIINPDRSMPVVNDREVPALEIPAPIRDFTPTDLPAEPVARASKAPLFIGLGLVAAVAAGIGFLVFKPSGAAPPAPSVVSSAKPAPVSVAPVTSQPAPSPAVTPAPPSGSSTGLGGDVQPRKPKQRSSDDAKATVGDGLEPPPEEMMPAAPTIGTLGDGAALPTVDAGGASLKMVDRANALERQRRLIDSSMKQ